MNRDNRGLTLIELVVASIITILLGLTVPNLGVIAGFRTQRAANSITAALNKTRMEAMSRLVGEMKLTRRSDGYYITYYLDRGRKAAGISEEDEERIAPSRVQISYTDKGGIHDMGINDSLILTYNRDSGGFRPIQDAVITQEMINDYLSAGSDIPFTGGDNYCLSIQVSGGRRTYIIDLIPATGKYEIHAG